ncbi:MAG TPA: DCC1-like thiol-disulfide oxidoreductase family protein [Vicinamibacterales bacterium]|nr:DCC1-like thiol-disulfide oxidoreductase family protein [Vicinamibacterales bacterium]
MASLVLFDGVCNLCDGFVQFVIARDPSRQFHFGTLQSSAARQVLDLHDTLRPLPDTMVLVEDGHLFTRSTAALRIARRLTLPWSLAYAFIAVPRPLRDWIYDLVARYRYRLFGQRDQCMVPTPDLRSRFID